MLGTSEAKTRAAAVAARLDRLASDQRAAATAAPGPVLCVAPAGSGKTTTVVARLVWRVSQGTDPATICALTFNRRAAVELQERVNAALTEMGVAPGSVRVRTFHALGREILADAGVDVTRLVERSEVLQRISQGELTEAGQRWLDEAFTRLKLDPERAPPATDLACHASFAAYTAELRRLEALDLDDLVARPITLLGDDAELLGRWRERCRTLFVDEAQDLDRAQLELTVLLAGKPRDVFLVGDDDQTIYAWRLADVRRVLGLASRLPGLRRVDLETNHRSAPEIVARAARLVEHNDERFDKRILASPAARGEVRLAPDPADDVSRARRLLSAWVARDTGSHAILARTNRELAPYAAVARERGLAIEIAADELLFDDEGAQAVIDHALRMDIGSASALLPRLHRAAVELGSPEPIVAAVLGWAAAYPDLPAFAAAWKRARQPPAGDLDGPPLALATVHSTKGLEWDHVACVGFDADRFPSARSLGDASDPARALEEERRLAYVAWTRARTTLTIVYDPAEPSLFLEDAFDADELTEQP